MQVAAQLLLVRRQLYCRTHKHKRKAVKEFITWHSSNFQLMFHSNYNWCMKNGAKRGNVRLFKEQFSPRYCRGFTCNLILSVLFTLKVVLDACYGGSNRTKRKQAGWLVVSAREVCTNQMCFCPSRGRVLCWWGICWFTRTFSSCRDICWSFELSNEGRSQEQTDSLPFLLLFLTRIHIVLVFTSC